MASARPVTTLLRRAPRLVRQKRLASTHGGHSDPGHGEESFGRSFYFAVLLVPLSMSVYAISRDSKNGERNPVTRLLERYSDWRDEWARRTDVHTRMVEQAGHDRNLFQNSPQPNWHDLRMPEMFNAGSPCAVPAGHNINLEHVMEHYRQRNEREEAVRLEKKRQQDAAKTHR